MVMFNPVSADTGDKLLNIGIFIFIIIRHLIMTNNKLTSKGKYTYKSIGNREFG